MITIERTVDISKPIQTETLRGNEFKLEANAHTFRISVVNNGAAVPLTGSVSASMLLADGSGLTLGGSLDNGVAVLTLPQAAYGVPGRFLLAIYSVQTGATEAETVKTCIYACVGAVVNTYGDQQYDPGNLIPDAETLAAYIEACQTATTAANTAAGRAETAALTAVTYAEQTGKTDAEKAQARENIGAASEAVETAMADHFPATGKLVAGISTTASANGAVATGVSTTASGRASHAEGQLTTADGQVAHAEGYGTEANGDYSHAEGFGTKASGDNQHAFGKYNVEDANDTYLEVAGNGTADEARSNARTLDWNGNEALAGDLTVNKGKASEMAVGAELSSLKSAIQQNITFTDASYIKHADGTVGSNYQSTKASEFIAVIPGEMFNLSGYVGSETISSIIGLAFYDKNKTYVSGIQYDGNNISVVTPQTAMFVRFTVYTSCISSYIVNAGSISPTHDFTLLSDFQFSIAEKQTGLKNLGAMPKYRRLIDNITFENGKYIMMNGTVGSIFYASLSEYIDVTDIEAVYASLSNNFPVSYFDENKQWISNFYGETVQSYTEAVPKEYSVTIPANAKYIRISNIHTSLSDASVYVGVGYGYIKNIQEKNVAVVSGKYVAVINAGAEASVAYAQLTDYLEISGLEGYRTSLSDILSACYYDADKNYISGVTGESGEAPAWRDINAPENAMYIRISNDTRYNTTGVSVKTNILKKMQNVARKEDIQYLQEQIDDADTPRNILSMYDDIICIGDSLTWSQVYYSSEGQRQAYKTYPQILGSLCGAESHQYATPGDTAILWWQRSSTGAFSNHGLYIVFLGTNAGFTDTIATDCVGTDPDNFANTNTGQYGRILQTITNNRDKAILVLPYVGGGGTAEALATTRDVINQFGVKYNFPVINLDNPARTNAYYHYYPDKSGQNTVHFNDLGYTWVANEICQQINKLPVADQWNISRTQ